MISAKDREKYGDIILSCPLFLDIPEDLIYEMIEELHGKICTYSRNEILLRTGEAFHYCGLVLSGKIEVSYDTSEYEKRNVNHFGVGQIFGEALAIKGVNSSPVQVASLGKSVVLLIDIRSLMVSPDRCNKSCLYNHQLLLNLMHRMADQNTFFNLKVRILSEKALRDRVMIYLTSRHADSEDGVTIPFNQTAFAEFLGVNRSALSRELGRMQDEGILEIDGMHYRILT